jgi:hypothetical protein
MKILQEAHDGTTTVSNTFQMQKTGNFNIQLTGSPSGATMTLSSSHDGTTWTDYTPDGTVEAWSAAQITAGEKRAYTDGPAWFRFYGDNSGADIDIFVGGNGLTLN